MTPDIFELDKAFSITPTSTLIENAILFEQFLATIFPIKEALNEYYEQAKLQEILAEFKSKFIRRRVLVKYKSADKNFYDAGLANIPLLELAKIALSGSEDLERIERWCAYKVYLEPDHSVFILPKKLDFDNLVGSDKKYRPKDAADEAHYCIYCHNQEKDSCRTGISDKAKGCPLGQKISEMNYLYSRGNIIAALAVTMIDNPLVAITGHRVCNDCMKSCIFQKQEPVDIPTIESSMMRSVLSLTYGAEIYYLLTRWNPLCGFIAKEDAPGSSLVAGLGPAGIAMSYYLLREGHKVEAIDAMDIKPLPLEFLEPIENWMDLAKRYAPQGFGGVLEYGITDRWDKSYLLLMRVVLERFKNFSMQGSTKFDHSMTEKFGYTALCLGSGVPRAPQVVNVDAEGVYAAYDFLMAMNMGRAVPIANGPILVIGAGLTAIDCAMEAKKLSSDVTILYRKSLQEAPSYKENHEELQIAIDAGIKFVENTDLKSIEVGESGAITSVNGSIPAKALIFAFGTSHENDNWRVTKNIGIFGDLDPVYSGSVVKAIASAKNVHMQISTAIATWRCSY